jgi:hypothetical protein
MLIEQVEDRIEMSHTALAMTAKKTLLLGDRTGIKGVLQAFAQKVV